MTSPDTLGGVVFDDSGLPSTAGAPVTSDSTLEDLAVTRFRSCRWHEKKDDAEYCAHGEVLPYAGRNGFKPRAWCLECGFYKLRRTVKRRSPDPEY